MHHSSSILKSLMVFQVGICIGRRNAKLGSTVTIRNVDDGIPFEAKFDIYSPLVDKIEVLELSRRRRAKLYYLRDRPEKVCELYHSIIFDMKLFYFKCEHIAEKYIQSLRNASKINNNNRTENRIVGD